MERKKNVSLVASVKTNTSLYPKKEIEKIMKGWPGGSYLVLECTTPDTKVDLVAIGYKYNSRKTLCFIMSKNAEKLAIFRKVRQSLQAIHSISCLLHCINQNSSVLIFWVSWAWIENDSYLDNLLYLAAGLGVDTVYWNNLSVGP